MKYTIRQVASCSREAIVEGGDDLDDEQVIELAENNDCWYQNEERFFDWKTEEIIKQLN